ncbi:MAG: hypothetical protein JWQ09_998 [Segetibacter sp.]|nr:hypothetical protein [Segetibacter sp.]
MNDHFLKLIENIKLTEKQQEDAITKFTNVCKTIHASYYPEIEYDGSTIVLIGSYGKMTNIRPPRDIDVVFKLPVREFTRINGLNGNKQSQLLQHIRSILIDRFPLTKEISAWGKVVVVPFSEGTHTVEVLPAWERPDGSFTIPNSENGGFWDWSHPVAEMNHIFQSNEQTGISNDFIRICKKWVEFCNVDIESFIVEIVIVNYLVDHTFKNGYALLTYNFFVYLIGQVNTVLLRPTGALHNLGYKWLSRAISARDRAAKAINYERSGSISDAVGEWKKIFGDDFQHLQQGKLSITEQLASLRAKYPAPHEQYLESTYGIPISLNPAYQVKIDAQISQPGYRAKSLSEFVREKLRLKRFKSITFKIKKNNVPDYDEIRWKVRNFGEEAQAINQLRGEISLDTGKRERTETTKYFGDHLVECYVIKNGVCVAMDRVFVPIGFE